MLRDDALKYFSEFVLPVTTSVNDAFDSLPAHFTTPAHKDTYATEWNTISQLLDLLLQPAKELQSLPEKPYGSPLLLSDYIIRAVKDEKFYLPLITTTVPEDPNALRTRLHQCIRQLNTTTNPSPSSSTQVFFTDPEPDEQRELELHYNSNAPFFKRQIMCGSNSFSPPTYNRNNYGRNNYSLGRNSYRGRPF